MATLGCRLGGLATTALHSPWERLYFLGGCSSRCRSGRHNCTLFGRLGVLTLAGTLVLACATGTGTASRAAILLVGRSVARHNHLCCWWGRLDSIILPLVALLVPTPFLLAPTASSAFARTLLDAALLVRAAFAAVVTRLTCSGCGGGGRGVGTALLRLVRGGRSGFLLLVATLLCIAPGFRCRRRSSLVAAIGLWLGGTLATLLHILASWRLGQNASRVLVRDSVHSLLRQMTEQQEGGV